VHWLQQAFSLTNYIALQIVHHDFGALAPAINTNDVFI